MKKIVFSKYSNERAPRFQIRTDILVDENQNKTVQKIGLTDASVAHIDNNFKMYESLGKMFEGTKFEICKTEKLDDRTLEFEFLYGTPMEQILDEYLYNEDLASFTKVLDSYVEEMKKLCVDHFKKDTQFEEIFGNVTLEENGMSLPVSNVDQIFQNIIVKDDKWLVYDFEWTFPFMIPLKYIFYRCALYYGEFERKSFLAERLNLFKYFGITEKEKITFAKMEQNLSEYIIKGFTPLYEVYNQIGNRNFDCRGLELENAVHQSGYTVTIGITDQDGNTESRNLYLNKDDSGKISFEVAVSENIQTLVIRPAQKASIVTIHTMNARGFFAKEKDVITNGIDLRNKTYCFPSGDAAIFLNDFAGFHTLYVEMSVSLIEGAVLAAICNRTLEADNLEKSLNESFASIHELHETVQRLQGDIAKSNEEASRIQNEYNAYITEHRAVEERLQNDLNVITGSFCWRMTKPLRKILDLIKGRK